MTYTEVGFSLISGFKKKVLKRELVLVLNGYTSFPSTIFVSGVQYRYLVYILTHSVHQS